MSLPVEQPGVELATSKSHVQLPNDYATVPHWVSWNEFWKWVTLVQLRF